MHVMEVALFANFIGYRHEQVGCRREPVGCRREQDEPMPEQWPRPRRSHAANIALAGMWAVGIAVIIVGAAVVA